MITHLLRKNWRNKLKKKYVICVVFPTSLPMQQKAGQDYCIYFCSLKGAVQEPHCKYPLQFALAATSSQAVTHLTELISRNCSFLSQLLGELQFLLFKLFYCYFFPGSQIIPSHPVLKVMHRTAMHFQ